MCRNIKTLYNFEPPATDEDIHASALQYVRKVSGFTRPSRINQEAFDRAVREVGRITRELVNALETKAPARDRDVEAARTRARGLAGRGVPESAASPPRQSPPFFSVPGRVARADGDLV